MGRLTDENTDKLEELVESGALDMKNRKTENVSNGLHPKTLLIEMTLNGKYISCMVDTDTEPTLDPKFIGRAAQHQYNRLKETIEL